MRTANPTTPAQTNAGTRPRPTPVTERATCGYERTLDHVVPVAGICKRPRCLT
jgi:hypothetical protein